MRIDMRGKKCGQLEVLWKTGVYRGYDTVWLCRCKCGRLSNVRGSFLRNGHTKTCGHCVFYAEEDGHMRCTVASGRSFIFDTEDYDLVSGYRWSVSNGGYVLGCGKEGQNVKLHRLLLGNPNCVVDHINGDPSDCRKCNLRLATQHQNTQNSKLPKSSTTGYKGVCYDKSKGKYMAYIHPNGKMKFLGYYENPVEAALAYDEAAFLYFGKFARPNFKKEEQTDEDDEVLGMEESGGDGNGSSGKDTVPKRHHRRK